MRRFIVFAIFSLSSLAFGSTLQVGSGQTYTTVQACLTAMAAGDICNVHAGTYTEQLTYPSAGTLGNLKTVRNNPGDTVVIQSTSTPVVALKSYVAFTGDTAAHLTVQYTGSGANPIVFNNTHGTSINGVVLTNITTNITDGSGDGFCWTIADSDSLTITGSTCHVSAAAGSYDGGDFLFASHLTLTNNTVFGDSCVTATTLEDGFVVSGTNLTITGNTLHDGCSFDNHPDGIVIQGDGDRAGGNTDNVNVSRNIIYNFTQGVYVDAIHAAETNILVYNNLLYETSAYRYGGVANKMNCAVLDGESLSGPHWPIQVGFYNNTLDCKQLHIYTLRLVSGAAITIRNNISLTTPFTGLYYDDNTGVSVDWDYFSQSDSTPIHWGASNYSRASFISGGFGESNSSAGTADLNTDYTEKLTSPTRSVATNLTSIFTDSLGGVTRPSSGAWDSGAYQIVVGTPVAQISPVSRAFSPPSQVILTSTSPFDFTLTNTGTANLTISGISITGTDSSQFSQTNTCPGILGFGLGCTISATFSPTTVGAKTAAISIVDDASGSPQTAALTGTGIAPDPIVISPTSAILRVNATQTFTATKGGGAVTVTWSCPTCAGSVNSSTGVYTAPATIITKDSVNGCPTSPIDSIWNTRMDTQPLNPNSATMMAATGSGFLQFSFGGEWDTPYGNYDDGTLPTGAMTFVYTPASNGTYKIPQRPSAQVQSGYFPYLASGDRHILTTIGSTCEFQELYGIHGTLAMAQAGTISPAPNTQSGTKYSSDSYAFPLNVNGAGTSAAGTPLFPLNLHLQEVEKAALTGGEIQHIMKLSMKNNNIKRSLVWPAQTFTTSAFGTQTPYGTIFRLKSSFVFPAFSAACTNVASNGNPSCQTIVNVLLTQMKHYGSVITDGGTNWAPQSGMAPWPPVYQTAMTEIRNKGLAAASNMEVVDVSALLVSASSAETRIGERVIATEVANPTNISSVPVVLRGVAINSSQDVLNVQAGQSAFQLPAPYITGTATTTATYTMNPAVGTLTSGGLYTPPASVTNITPSLVTITSTVDSNAVTYMTINVMPTGTIRLALGRTTNYTDVSSNVWQQTSGLSFSNGTLFGDYSSLNLSPNSYTWTGTDINLYKQVVVTLAYKGDIVYSFHLPAGNYNVTAKMVAAWNPCTTGTHLWNLEVQGQTIYPSVDLAAGTCFAPQDFVLPAVVGVDNTLTFALRPADGSFPFMPALQIDSVSPPPPADQTAVPSPASLTFTGLTVGVTSAAQTITITNNGTVSSLHITGTPALSGADAAKFSISSTTCTGATIAPAGTCTISVTVTPTSQTTLSASVDLTDDAPNSPQAIPLSAVFPAGGFVIKPGAGIFRGVTIK